MPRVRKAKSARQLEAEIKTSLAERARAAVDPNTREGGRAMMQSVTMADIRAIKPVGSRIPTGTEVTFSIQYIGGSQPHKGVVTWDNGRGKVDIRTSIGGRSQTVSATEAADGSLYVLG